MHPSRIAHGGVSGRPRGAVLYGIQKPRAAAPSPAGRFPNLVNHGGPVVASPALYVSFWGPSWHAGAAQTAAATRLAQFCMDILRSGFMNVLTQYGVGNGRVAATSTIPNVAAQLTNAAIEGVIQQAIDAGTLPEPPANNTSDVLIAFLDESIEVKDTSQGIVMCEPSGDTAFGYHDFFTTSKGNPFYYAIIPALDDACLKKTCPNGDATCSLKLTLTQEQRRTQVASHELAEMFTDPELNAWFDEQNGEIGDVCNGESAAITVGSNTWTVQPVYSKDDDVRTNGATYCLAQAAAPEPRA